MLSFIEPGLLVANATPVEKFKKHTLKRKEGKAFHAQRRQTMESVFGVLEDASGSARPCTMRTIVVRQGRDICTFLYLIPIRRNTMKSRLLSLAIAAATALAAGATSAQTTQKADGQWRGSLGAGASFTSGNTRSTSANLNAEAIRLTSGDKTRLYATAVYGKNNDIESANLFRAGGRYDYDLGPRTFAFGGLDLESDKIGNLKSRFAPSVGLGFNVIKNQDTTFAIFGGVGYVQDAFFRPVVIDGALRDDYGRAELLLGEESTHKLSNTTSFRQRFVVYPNLNDTGAYRAVFDAGLAVAMSSRMSLTVGLVSRYNSDPGLGIKKSDTLFVTGVAVKID